MTGTLTTSPGPGFTARRSSVARGLLLALGAVLVVLAVAVFSHTSGLPLDPANNRPNGAQALATVLGDHGIEVQVVHSPSDISPGADATILVTRSGALAPEEIQTLAQHGPGRAGRLVLVGPTTAQLRALGLPTTSGPAGAGEQTAGDCPVDWARGLTIAPGDVMYKPVAPGTHVCFAGVSGGGSLLVDQGDGDRPEIVVLGASRALSNRYLADQDNAALAVRALGSRSTLVWLSPDLSTDPAPVDQQPTFPAWTGPAALLALATLVLLALWRGRRFGRLVREPLAVIVKASDTTRSRAELYRHARDTERTGAVLRTATTQRLRHALALQPAASPADVVTAAARRSGRPEPDLHRLLYGDPPRSEPDLTELAQQLRDLERQVRP